MQKQQKLLTTKELAEVLNFSTKTIQRWLKSGKISAEIRGDREPRFDLEKVKAALNR